MGSLGVSDRSTPPNGLKRRRMVSAKLPEEVDSSASAIFSIVCTSYSMYRPFSAALILRCSFSDLSIFMILILGIKLGFNALRVGALFTLMEHQTTRA